MPTDTTEDDEYEWTAEALQDSAGRLAKHITTSPSAVVFRQAAVTKWTEAAPRCPPRRWRVSG